MGARLGLHIASIGHLRKVERPYLVQTARCTSHITITGVVHVGRAVTEIVQADVLGASQKPRRCQSTLVSVI